MRTKTEKTSESRVGKVTKRTVEELQKEAIAAARYAVGGKRKPREFFLWDTEIANFGVRVKPSGHATFILRYRIGDRRKQESIGAFEDPWTVQMAREKALSLKGGVVQGVDPKVAREEIKGAPTMSQLAIRFLEQHVGPKRKPTTEREYRRQIETLILPALGRRPVKDITAKDVDKLHHSLKATPVQANRVVATLSKMFSLAEQWGLRPRNTNPCVGIEKYPEQPRQRFLTQEEFARLGKALDQADRARREWPFVTPAIRLLMFTGARLNEILSLRWDQVDTQRRILRLSDHKTSSKTGERIIHLNEAALAVLVDLPRLMGNPYVIPGRRTGTHLVNLEDPWQRIRANALLDDVRLHDLRHSYAAVLASSGVSLPMIGALLGHTQPRTTQRYAHLAESPLKEVNESVGQKIRSVLGGTEKPS